ncbi:MAG TPA: carboxypeptidase-like regulatory domain-containing protein, partial [Planctomycetota bacterium]|nr:carboxypeptidase-like regulatory domain-containing protein [Planctomycetota bacterium]
MRRASGLALAAAAALILIAALVAWSLEASRHREAVDAVATSAGAPALAVASHPASSPAVAVSNADAPTAREVAADETPATIASEPTLLERTGLRGRIVDARTGLPILRFKVTATPKAESDPSAGVLQLNLAKWRKSKTGTFTIRNLAAGRVRVIAFADDYVAADSEFFDVVPGVVSEGPVLSLEPVARIRGRVVDAIRGDPIPGATVSTSPVHNAEPFSRTSDTIVTSGPDGGFELKEAAGLVRVIASHPELADGVTAPFDLASGATVDAGDIALRAGGALEGTALDRDGSPMAGGRAYATRYTTTTQHKSVVIGEKGEFRIVGLSAGTWDVSAKPGGDPREAHRREIETKAEVVEGRTTRVEFPPPETGGCTVRGHVVRRGTPVASHVVALIPRHIDTTGK